MGKIDMIRGENGILRRVDRYLIARPNTCQSGFELGRLIRQEDCLGRPTEDLSGHVRIFDEYQKTDGPVAYGAGE